LGKQLLVHRHQQNQPANSLQGCVWLDHKNKAAFHEEISMSSTNLDHAGSIVTHKGLDVFAVSHLLQILKTRKRQRPKLSDSITKSIENTRKLWY
jgi:hypothetical protein